MKQVNQKDIPEYSNILLFLFLGIRSTVLNAPLIVVPMNTYESSNKKTLTGDDSWVYKNNLDKALC